MSTTRTMSIGVVGLAHMGGAVALSRLAGDAAAPG
jgi:hypothetical protein